MNIHSASLSYNSYNYKYYFYLKVYDSNGVEKISKGYFSSSSTSKLTYSVSSTQLSPGIYTIKLLNNIDNYVMSTANLTVLALTSDSYSADVSDTTINYDDGGIIKMYISPTNSSYIHKYDFYLKVYDLNGNQKISQRYYSTSSSSLVSYNVGSKVLNSGNYTLKLVNYYDNYVMSVANLTVLALTSDVYSVNVSDTTLTYGVGGNIVMNITPASSEYSNKYDFYLKIYDSNGNEKINQRYYSTNSSNSINYIVSPTQLTYGSYTIKILNYYDNVVM